jgi:hypothetical protein
MRGGRRMTIDDMYFYLIRIGYEPLFLDGLYDEEIEDLYYEVVEDE